MEGERGAVPFIVNRSTPFVTENRNGISFTRIPGRFSICDSVNGNNRRYPKKVWEKNLAEGSALKECIKRNAAFGLLEHPSNGQISLLSPICILVTDAQLKPGKDDKGSDINEVMGEIIIINTAEGQKLKALVEVGYNPLVSSRGFGSVIKAGDGIDEVQEDYVCEGWDVVLKPSFEKAELWPQREGVQQEGKALTENRGVNLWCVFQHLAEKTHGKSWQAITDSERDAIAEKVNGMTQADKIAIEEEFNQKRVNDAAVEKVESKNLPQQASPSAAAAPTAQAGDAGKQLTETKMNINEIKSRIGAVRGQAVPRDPARFAEGMNELSQIHQEVATWLSEDAKRTYQASRLHEEVEAIEKSWSEAQTAPSRQAVKLNENYGKVLKVTKALGEAAVGLRKKLGEAVSQQAEATELIEELTQRGQAWVAVADKRKETIAELEHRLNVACEALDIIAKRYHEDMTDVGRRLITLEFAEKAQAPDIQKALKEAKKPADIIAIREKLDPEAAKAAAKAQQESECDKCHKKPCECKKEESKEKASAKEGAAAPAAQQESKSAKGTETSPELSEVRVLVPSVRSITESVAMVQRLSASATDQAKANPAKAEAKA